MGELDGCCERERDDVCIAAATTAESWVVGDGGSAECSDDAVKVLLKRLLSEDVVRG